MQLQIFAMVLNIPSASLVLNLKLTYKHIFKVREMRNWIFVKNPVCIWLHPTPDTNCAAQSKINMKLDSGPLISTLLVGVLSHTNQNHLEISRSESK